MTVLLISQKSNFTKGKVTLGCIRFITYLSSTWIILLNYTSLSLFAKFYQLSKIILESQNDSQLEGEKTWKYLHMVYSCLLYTSLLFCIIHFIIYILMSCLDHPNCFGRVQIILVRFKLCRFSGLFFIIWTRPKWIPNNWHPSKIILDP